MLTTELLTKQPPTIRVVFSDTREEIKSCFDSLFVKKDHIELTNVRTYVNLNTPHIEMIGADADGDIIFNQIGVVYFEAVDRIEVIRDSMTSVLFERSIA